MLANPDGTHWTLESLLAAGHPMKRRCHSTRNWQLVTSKFRVGKRADSCCPGGFIFDSQCRGDGDGVVGLRAALLAFHLVLVPSGNEKEFGIPSYAWGRLGRESPNICLLVLLQIPSRHRGSGLQIHPAFQGWQHSLRSGRQSPLP